MQHAENVLAVFTRDWTVDNAVYGTSVTVLECATCRDTDLLDVTQRFGFPHAVVHSLVAPVEEVIDDAASRFVTSDDPAIREQRLEDVDTAIAQLRARARDLVSVALGETDPELAAS